MNKEIDKILERGVIAEVLPTKKGFKKALLGDKKLKFYLGIDPTAASIHLGHAQNIMLLEDFRSLGHEAILLIGDFTARIGDPSGMTSARKPLSLNEIRKNVEEITKNIDNIIGIKKKKNPAKLLFNSQWLEKLNFEEVLSLSSNFTVQQMIERDMFRKRIEDKRPIFLNEFFYPLMQGYDSVAMNVDAEIGGTDQTFNMLAGRTLLRKLKNKEKFIITTNLIQNPKTGELMSMSKGTGVFVNSPPKKMFGEVMAQPDEIISVLFKSNTRVPLEEIKETEKRVKEGGEEVRDIKMRLAEEIVSIFYSSEKACKVKEEYKRTFSKKKLPRDIKLKKHPLRRDALLNIVWKSNLVSSKTEARRLIKDGAVEINGEKIKEEKKEIDLTNGIILKIGKHRFLKLESE